VTWPTVPDATDYVVTPLRAGVAGAHPPQVVPGGSARFVGLLGGFTYTFTVVARNAAGLASAASPPSNEIFAHFPPGPPKGVTGRQTGANTYVISWTEAYPNGTPITSYVVRNPAGATLATVSGDSRGATVTATGLAEVRVSATNGDGEGPAGSGPVTVTTYGAQVTCTDSPSNPQPNFCAAGLPVYFAANDDGAVSRRVANGQRINVVCRAYGEDQDAGPYNNFKHGGHWLRFTDGTYISRVWLEIDNDDVVEAIPVC
jgi:hypothetical protein